MTCYARETWVGAKRQISSGCVVAPLPYNAIAVLNYLTLFSFGISLLKSSQNHLSNDYMLSYYGLS